MSTEEATEYTKYPTYCPPGTQELEVLENRLMSDPSYDRDVRHYSFSIKDKGMSYGTGDCLSVNPHNVPE